MKILRSALVLGLLLHGGFLQALSDKDIVDLNRERIQQGFDKEFNERREISPDALVRFAAAAADEKIPTDAKAHPQFEKFNAMTQAQRLAAAREIYAKFPDKKIAENLLLQENLSTEHKLMLALTKLREHVAASGKTKYPETLQALPAEIAKEVPTEIEYRTTGEILKVHYIGGQPLKSTAGDEPIFWLEMGAHPSQAGSGAVIAISGKVRFIPKDEFARTRKDLEAASIK